jgi:hypothetical protein
MTVPRVAARIAVAVVPGILALSCSSPSIRRLADCAPDPVMDDVAWPFDRLTHVTTEYTVDASGDNVVVGFHFDLPSKRGVRVSLGPTQPPFVERGVWPAAGIPVVVGGGRYYELLLEGLTQAGGDRIRSDVGVVRDVINVEAEGAADESVRWVVGFVEPSCMSLSADAEAARIELGLIHALP